VPILSRSRSPRCCGLGAGTDADLRLAWQEFLVRIIANAFDLPAQFLGLEQDVNRATAGNDERLGFRSAIVPTARLVAEYLTRERLESGWDGRTWSLYSPTWMRRMRWSRRRSTKSCCGTGGDGEEVRRARGLAEII